MTNILKVPLADRQAAWKLQHGEVCMGHVLSLCDRLRPVYRNPGSVDSPALHAYIIALYTLYGRPFKQDAPFRLGNEVVPAPFESAHKSMMSFRDKVFSHIDCGEKAMRSDEDDMLSKMVIIVGENQILCTMSCVLPNETVLEEVAQLAQEVSTVCERKLSLVFSRYSDPINAFDAGNYEINIDATAEGPILKPL